MGTRKPIKVAIVGGGCASIAAAFELTRPQHKGLYQVTIYQVGWRLGGKGSSGRGPAGRIEEHGLHVWLGFYDNAFQLLRQCYEERNAGSKKPGKNWDELFMPEPYIAVAGSSANGGWANWASHFPPAPGLPGDPLDMTNPFALRHYFGRAVALLRTLLLGLDTFHPVNSKAADDPDQLYDEVGSDSDLIVARMARLMRSGVLLSAAVVIEALALTEAALKSITVIRENAILKLVEAIAAAIRQQFERLVAIDDRVRYQWEIVDLILANLVGAVRFGLLTNPNGLDAINHFEHRQWLRHNGASERAINSPFTRILYDLTLAYEDGDPERPAIAAGTALRGTLRLLFCYRGSPMWKMRAGMGDVVFAPFYEVLRRRGVTFKFFHRLCNVTLVDREKLEPGEKQYVEALEFDVQAETTGGREYQPLVTVRGMQCWPSEPDYGQLKGGAQFRREKRDFESHWDQRRTATLKLRVTRDFHFVVLGVGIGALPHVCSEIIASNPRWRTMVERVKTVATQAFQIWLNADLQELGWELPPVTLTSFVKPFDTWADMGHLVPAENWRSNPPRTVAYFCNVLADPPHEPDAFDIDYPARRREEVRLNAISFLDHDIRHLWPAAERPAGGFCWEFLVHPEAAEKAKRTATSSRFDSQFWTANVNPSDRYSLSLPGNLEYRISPLDNTYDNLTIAGDWTECSLNLGCVESAVMSGRLAAHALSRYPALEDIIGYDHP